MLQQTSLKAYNELQDWLVNKTYSAILSCLANNPNGLTDREIASILGYSDPNKVRPRRKELEDKGLIYETSKRVCQVSGKTAIIWKIDTGVIHPLLFPMENNMKQEKRYV